MSVNKIFLARRATATAIFEIYFNSFSEWEAVLQSQHEVQYNYR